MPETAGAHRTRRVRTGGGAELFVTEAGDASRPTILLVHGFPDTHAVWDELVGLLLDRFHVVAYDIRGTGRSTNPGGADAMVLDRLAGDLAAVADALSPGAPVHLVGHDWGAFQCWHALTGDRLTNRIASYTAIAGPRIDEALPWALRRLRPWPPALAELAGQLRRSWYIAALQVPALPELALGSGLTRGFARMLRLTEGIEPRDGHPAPTLAQDAANGLALYRKNLGGRPRAAPVSVPLQLIVPTRDPYISPALYSEAGRWGTRVWRRDIRAGHWVQRSHPAPVARAIAELVEHAEGAPPAPALRRARQGADGLRLGGRLAVVTGAGAGIGRATALTLARAGAEVVAADVDVGAAKATARSGGAGVHAIKLDVADRRAMERFAGRVARTYGVPSILVNNAGIAVTGPFVDTSGDDWQRVVDVNLMGVVHGARLFARQMVDAGQEGQIVNVASAAAFAPSRAMPAYSTTKAAVLMLSECMRAELADAGIGVTAVCPGFVATDITRSMRLAGAGEGEERLARSVATAAYRLRGYPPERVADAIVAALWTNPAIVAVTPEAHAIRAVSRVAPGVLRLAARVDPSAGLRRLSAAR